MPGEGRVSASLLVAYEDVDGLNPNTEIPYLIHTDIKLFLMLGGTKPFARFVISYPVEEGEDSIELLFEPHVQSGLIVKRVVIEPLCPPVRGYRGRMYDGCRHPYYALPGEEWRIDANRIIICCSRDALERIPAICETAHTTRPRFERIRAPGKMVSEDPKRRDSSCPTTCTSPTRQPTMIPAPSPLERISGPAQGSSSTRARAAGRWTPVLTLPTINNASSWWRFRTGHPPGNTSRSSSSKSGCATRRRSSARIARFRSPWAPARNT